MSSIKKFMKSKARPGDLLTKHLEEVKESIEYFLKDYNENLVRLAGLAGVCHDVGKNNIDWQNYINNSNKTKGPGHSNFGAFLFSYLGFQYLTVLNLWEEYKTQWVWLIRDIADHHSRLRNLSNDNWIRLYNWDKYDLVGIEHFIKKLYPELKNVIINEEELEKWLVNVKSYLKDTQYKLYLEKEDMDSIELSLMLQNWRTLTTSIISSDRFNVGDVESTWISKKANEKYIKNINIFCEKNQNQPLSATRMKAQTQVMDILAKQPNERFYNLSMPTGYGKTITALKMANWFVEKQNFKKIVYVAPYLSILEQTSETIEKAMDEKPLEHHSLAIIDKDDEQRVGENQLWMESWAHSIICTSFNQFSKAIFPRRAQDTLRRAFLKDCIVIIDEPQIFNPDVWNLFLCGLEGLSNLLNLKIIFVSATMPPFDYGLTKTPVNLNIAPMHQKERYKLYIDDDIESETTLANRIKNNKVKSQAAILNTIEDAYRVYEALNMDEAYLLHGLIIPIHKKYIIEKMKHDLKEGKYPLYLISTQVIEAGVDISFQNIFRALPILPSIIQAAGRLNRHNEGEEGSIYTFPFYRFLKQDTRRYIYPKELINITDNLINKKDIFGENELTDLVKQYYHLMFKQNTYEGSLYYLEEAYFGKWEELSNFRPFNDDYLRLPIFVPWDNYEESFVDNKFLFLKEKFKITNSYDIYERYSDSNYMSKLSFQDRKQFMILFYYYVLNLPVNHALKIASQEDFLNSKIPILQDSFAYDEKIGLKAPFEEYDNILL